MNLSSLNSPIMDLFTLLSSLIISNSVKHEETNLKKVAEVRIERERLESDRIKLDNRVKEEAARLMVKEDRFSVIRDILAVWGKDARIGLAIAKAESGLRCEAYHFNTNGTVDHSVFQLNSVHIKRGNLADCKENVRIAYEIYKEQGGNPWVVFWNKSYLKYL